MGDHFFYPHFTIRWQTQPNKYLILSLLVNKITIMKMYDFKSKIHFKVESSKDKQGFDIKVSSDKKTWKTEKTGITFDEVMKTKEEIINNNFNHLYKLITD